MVPYALRASDRRVPRSGPAIRSSSAASVNTAGKPSSLPTSATVCERCPLAHGVRSADAT